MTDKFRNTIFLLFLFIGITAFAQQKLTFRVADFSYDAFDQTARDERFKRLDGSGFLYAIVKISSDSPADKLGEYRFNFGNMNHISEDHDGELWLYVQKNAKIVTITRNGYFPVNHYDLNTTIESGKTYRMKLSAQGPVIYTQMVMFDITPADSKAMVMITKEESGQNEEVFGSIDETGGVAKSLEYGTYTYRVMAENYYPSEGRITLNNQDETHIEKVTLRSNGANITLDAGADAEIYVNGAKRGKNKWTGLLKAGNYNVECRMVNHRPSQQNINVEEGKDRTFQLTPPTPITGILAITSRPLGANINIDGKDYGTTPRNINNLLIGHHSITLSMSGYASKTGECDIREGETRSLEFAMEKSETSATPQASADSQTISTDGDKTFTVGNVSFVMKPVAGGTFTMGLTPEQGIAHELAEDRIPVHQVTLSSYYIGQTEVTQELWQAVMGSNPSKIKGSNLPVEHVSWDDCQEFIRKLNSITGQKFLLPTEAEWEYAARGGNKTKSYKYSGSNNIDDIAWYYDGNSVSTTHDVKTKQPNELGIYDMSGNVGEWCSDWYGDYRSNAQTNPTGPLTSQGRVGRGGSWNTNPRVCRISYRSSNTPGFHSDSLGLRLAL